MHSTYPLRFFILWMLFGAVSLSADIHVGFPVEELARRWTAADVAILDEAGVIPDSKQAELEQMLMDFHREKGVAVVVVTLPSLNGSESESFAADLYDAMELKEGKQRAGVLVLLAEDEGIIRIETTHGEGERLTPDEVARILDYHMVTFLKTENYSAAFQVGLELILEYLAPGYLDVPRQPPISTEANLYSQIAAYVVIAVCILLAIAAVVVRFILGFGRTFFRSGGFGGGGGFSGGGGFGGFGGGFSGGGGASGSW